MTLGGVPPQLINHDLVFCVILSETLASGACDESNVQDDFGAYWGSIEHRQAQDMTRQDKTWGQNSSILSIVFCCRVILVCTAKGQNLESSLIQQTQESCLVQPAAEYYILQVSGSFRNTWTNFVPAALPCLVKSRQSAAKAWPGKSGWQWNQVQNESQKVVNR